MKLALVLKTELLQKNVQESFRSKIVQPVITPFLSSDETATNDQPESERSSEKSEVAISASLLSLQ